MGGAPFRPIVRSPTRRGSRTRARSRVCSNGWRRAGRCWTVAPARSVALDLMRASGGRLRHRAVSVLRVVGTEPGLSNREVAVRVGIGDENNMSRHLARLARRGLIENTRNGGRYNVWRLTASGEELERAVWLVVRVLIRR